MYEKLKSSIDQASRIVVIQAENPDGDSLGSALALEEVLSDQGKQVSLYCPVDIPKYIRYLEGWSRVTNEFNFKADLAVIVDTASEVLLSKLLNDPAIRKFLYDKPVIVIDHHHDTQPDLQFSHQLVLEQAVSTSEELCKVFNKLGWNVNSQAAENLLAGIMSDSLGLTTPNTTAETYETAAELVKLGATPSKIDEARRELMKKSPEILAYKGRLIERVEYHLDGSLATVHIPWEEIKEYSDQYNPNVLILEEMRLVTDVKVAVAIKTYPDGKLTGKVRSSVPVAEKIAGFFGGGGHPYASGFRVYEDYDKILGELVKATDDILKDEAI
ncbi:MAG: DHH family phosphoesterase [Candidatus Nomurabacteria bacterium]|jgi:phosphoesterase RecJ-like protein|nr:DHH family phosphoesterase [Candidatus Nomurabacteria bacterium]